MSALPLDPFREIEKIKCRCRGVSLSKQGRVFTEEPDFSDAISGFRVFRYDGSIVLLFLNISRNKKKDTIEPVGYPKPRELIRILLEEKNSYEFPSLVFADEAQQI